MLVTINSDASYFPKTGQAGYAFWISSSKGRYKRYGRLDNADDCTVAECMSVINALHFVRTHPDLKDCKKIIVNCDSMAVYRMAHEKNGLRKRHQKKLRQLRGKMENYLGSFRGQKCEYEFRWVKGHNNGCSDARTYVNHWLDSKAKEGAKLVEFKNIKA